MIHGIAKSCYVDLHGFLTCCSMEIKSSISLLEMPKKWKLDIISPDQLVIWYSCQFVMIWRRPPQSFEIFVPLDPSHHNSFRTISSQRFEEGIACLPVHQNQCICLIFLIMQLLFKGFYLLFSTKALIPFSKPVTCFVSSFSLMYYLYFS